MRTVTAVSLFALSLAGCSTAREMAGEYQRFAEKGLTVVGGDTPDATDLAPADRKGRPLAGGLVGDTANRRYTTDAPASPQP